MTQARALAVLRIMIGVFFVCEGLSRWRWLADSGPLLQQLRDWSANPHPWSRWYLEHIALRGAPIFARLVPLGEMFAGIALVLGVWTRTAAVLTLLMVLNFHYASGRIFQFPFLTNGYGLPVLGSLLALAIGGSKLPWSIRR